MNLRLLLASAVMVLMFLPAKGQRTCATMEVLESQVSADPALQHRLDSIEMAHQTLEAATAFKLPVPPSKIPHLPGLVLTGDRETDVRNFSRIKQEMLASDPELYIRLTSKPSTSKAIQTNSK